MLAISIKSSSFNPLVVIAAEPILIPDVSLALKVSFGSLFLLTVIFILPRMFSASKPVILSLEYVSKSIK